ncbi:MAG: hypothetical protein V3T77_05505 [Planctomycetota bacterium]
MTRPGLRILVLLVLLAPSCTTSRHSAPEMIPLPESESSETATKAGMDRCPVCGTLLNRSDAHAFVYEGNTYFFCPGPPNENRFDRIEQTCLQEFKRNPVRFREKLTP